LLKLFSSGQGRWRNSENEVNIQRLEGRIRDNIWSITKLYQLKAFQCLCSMADSGSAMNIPCSLPVAL
jgi:hypothetical protein